MRVNTKDIKKELSKYYQDNVGFAPAKNAIDVLDISDSKCTVAINGKVKHVNFTFAFSIDGVEDVEDSYSE